MLHDVAVAILNVQNTSSTNDKKTLLKRYGAVPQFKEVLNFIYNPLFRTGVGENKLNNAMTFSKIKHEGPVISVSEARKYFEENNTGGGAAVEYAVRFIQSQETVEAKWLAACMVIQDLKIGVDAKTLNKIYGADFIPVFECMLGYEYSKVKEKMKGVYISSRKIDGQRRLIVKENGKVSMYTRNGLPDVGLIAIEAEVADFLPDNYVYDGELEAVGVFKDNLAKRQATNSIGNSKGKRTGVTFNIFDMVPLDEFKRGKSADTAIFRKKALKVLFDQLPPLMFVREVPMLCISSNLEDHEYFFTEMIKKGEEGIMLIKADSYYEVGKRSVTWVKMKKFKDMDVKVVDIVEGTGKNVGRLGAVVISYKGHLVNVGSGFTDRDRIYFWNNPDEIIGKTIEITHQGESNNKLGGISLNCPIFKGVRYDK